jgi:phage/conjugal plasmid C-4 type zinc finger TraR family protein
VTDYIDDAQDRALELNRRAVATRIASIRVAGMQAGQTECDDCGGDIEAARLKAVPSARRCRACQQAAEKYSKNRGG